VGGAHAPLLSSTLTQLLGEGGITEATFHTLARAIERAVERLVAADDAHATELSDDAKPRAERDAAAEVVGSELQFARSTIQPVYGEVGLKAAGLASPILRDPVALSRQGHQFITMATADGFAMPAPRKEAAKVDVAALVNDLIPPLSRLDAALKTVSQEEGEAQSTQAEKNLAFDAYETTFLAARDALYDLAVLAGRRDLGEKLPSLPGGGGASTAGRDSPPASQPA
jgi:hypothetical protein